MKMKIKTKHNEEITYEIMKTSDKLMEVQIEDIIYEIKKVSVIDYCSLEEAGLLDNLEKAATTEYDSLRQNALMVESTLEWGEKSYQIVFGYEIPETIEDFLNMCDDDSMWSSDWEVVETAKEI